MIFFLHKNNNRLIINQSTSNNQKNGNSNESLYVSSDLSDSSDSDD